MEASVNRTFVNDLVERSLAGETIGDEACLRVLADPEVELLPLLDAAFQVRKAHWGRDVQVHILNDVQNGMCPEDCAYCAQAKTSAADIMEYPVKSDEEILAEAKRAYESGAFRYCMVFAGRGPSQRRVEHLASLIRRIKREFPLEVCVSAGLLDEPKARLLREAGLDRLNHNLNTSERRYPDICTTHTYRDRIGTLAAARKAGLQLCSGLIAGMGESAEELVEIARTLRDVGAESIPVNFLVPVDGNVLDTPTGLTPAYCLRILCLYRFTNPKAEIRAAGGREGHLRSLEVMALYPANSLFLDGYLNTRGGETARVLRMIRDAGFRIQSDFSVDELLDGDDAGPGGFRIEDGGRILKTPEELRPVRDSTKI